MAKKKRIGRLPEKSSRLCHAQAFTPDGRILAATSIEGGRVKLWDVGAGKAIGQLLVSWDKSCFNKHYHVNVSFSPDGKTLATSDDLHEIIQLWDMPGKEILRFSGPGYVLERSFSPDGKTFITARALDGSLCLRETATGKERGRLSAGSPPTSLTFFPTARCWLWDTVIRRCCYGSYQAVSTRESFHRVSFPPRSWRLHGPR